MPIEGALNVPAIQHEVEHKQCKVNVGYSAVCFRHQLLNSSDRCSK
jgi:hypothetical protein